jgi:hypothetical protein
MGKIARTQTPNNARKLRPVGHGAAFARYPGTTSSPLAHLGWSFGGNDKPAGVLTRSRLLAEWADQPILVIGTHFAAPTAGHIFRDGAVFRFAV